jgi:tetratricopeptide (TPR) repeat protein
LEQQVPRFHINDNQPFLVAPNNFNTDDDDDEEVEVTVQELEGLLDFETNNSQGDDDMISVQQWKNRGDELLRLGDAMTAIGYYEAGLIQSSRLSIGSAVIIRQAGFSKLAEVDCIEQDGSVVDVSLMMEEEEGQEMTIPKRSILLCILDADDDRLQERILLNLARCLLQVAEQASISRRPRFLQSAVLACTLAMDVCAFRNHEHDNKAPAASSNNSTTTLLAALILRSQAQSALFKYDHAKADLKRLLSMDPNHKEGLRRMQQLERTKLQTKKADKKLVKELCQWVNVATTTKEPSPPVSKNIAGAPMEPSSSQPSDAHQSSAASTLSHSIAIASRWWILLFAIVIAYYVQR